MLNNNFGRRQTIALITNIVGIIPQLRASLCCSPSRCISDSNLRWQGSGKFQILNVRIVTVLLGLNS